MQYIIFHNQTSQFVHRDGVWVESICDATKFATIAKAKAFMDCDYDRISEGHPRSELSIYNVMDFKQRSSDYYTAEEAAAQLQSLIQFYKSTLETAKEFRKLHDYYNRIQSRTDKETNDFLHKIEFANENVVNGFKIYKQLQEVRQRRREAKDALDFYDILETSGLLKSLEKAVASLEKLQREQDKRDYAPRIRAELFI